MDSKKKKLGGFTITIVALLIASLMLVLMLISFKNGYLGNSTKNIKYYNSLDDMINSSTMNIELPQFIYDEQNLEIRNTMGAVIEIGNEHIVLKISNFVDNNADILGLYENSLVDNKYNVNSEIQNINFIRYRTGYSEYPNCTLINWCSPATTYGLMIGDIISEEEVLNLLGIQKSELSPNQDIQEQNNEVDIDNIGNITLKNYQIHNFTVLLPEFKSNANIEEFNDYATISINNHTILVFIYDNIEDIKQTFNNQSEIKVNDNLFIYYLAENPFDIETPAYNDYNKFINTIDMITYSISYLE